MGSVVVVEEAERVLERLRRIELLEQESAPPRVLLDEVRALLAEAEEWVRGEGRTEPRARPAVDGLRTALEAADGTVLAAERTLVA